MEADLAKAKLEAHGIPVSLADREMAAVHPLVFSEVRVQIRECDEFRARELLLRPADDDEGEYVDEDWRCPNCHRKTIDLLPLSRGWQATRAGCLTVALLPLLVPILLTVLALTEWNNQIGDAFWTWFVPWLLLVTALSVALLNARRRKRCRECGHIWSQGASEPVASR
jgi:hypothetical protein